MLTRNEANAMNERAIKNIALETINHKGYTSYIYKCFNGSFEELNCSTFYDGISIDCVAYPDYVERIEGLENYVEYVKRILNKKCFNVEDLKTINDYQDYKNKFDFLLNIYCQTIEAKSMYKPDVDTKVYKYRFSIYLFKYESDIENFKKLLKTLEDEFDKKMKNKVFFKSAVKYEMFNHETPINWDGWTPALESLGINYNKLSDEFKEIVNIAYKEVCREVEW